MSISTPELNMKEMEKVNGGSSKKRDTVTSGVRWEIYRQVYDHKVRQKISKEESFEKVKSRLGYMICSMYTPEALRACFEARWDEC